VWVKVLIVGGKKELSLDGVLWLKFNSGLVYINQFGKN
jgi:hypothetical protein